MRTVIYTRVSTASQEDGTSLESQEAACRKLSQDADAVREVYSGADLHDRPELNKVRDKIKAGYYNRVICYSIDRLSRQISHLMILIEEFERYNVTLEFVTESLDNSPEGKLLQSVKGYVAEVEREKIRERTMRGRRTKALNGTLSYRRKLFGYQVDDSGKRVVCDKESRVVLEIFKSIADGQSLRSLAQSLTANAVSTPHGSRVWWPHSIKSIINNPAYKGQTTLYRYKHETKFVAGKKKVNGSLMNPSEAHIILPEVTPAIVTPEEWEAAQIALKNNLKRRGRHGTPERLLRGFVRCGNCGRQFSPVGKRGYWYYVCTSTQNPSVNCKTKSFSAKRYEEEVWKDVCKLIKGKKPRKRKAYDPTPAIEKHQARLQNEIERLIERAGTVDEESWQIFQRQIIAKREEIARLESEKPKRERPQVSLESLQAEYSAKLDTLSFDAKVRLLRRLDLQLIWDGQNLLTPIM